MDKKYIFAVVFAAGAFFVYSFVFSSANLPPTDVRGHVEGAPPSRVLKEPMPIAVQKHMLEHADGYGPPGVIINYNCEDFECEPGLIEKLEAFAYEYSNVYVAPYPKMSVKIALTRYGKIKTLDRYDEEEIRAFIRGG